MKINEVTTDILKCFCKMDYIEDDILLPIFKDASLNYLIGFTGLTSYELNSLDDVTFAYLVLINEMSKSRNAVMSESKMNNILENILGMHSVNLIK